jgi:hypothetical protein
MVEEIKNIISRFPKQHKTDLEILVAFAKENPDESLPHLLLQNYTPDLFNSDLWMKADVIKAQYKGLLADSDGGKTTEYEAEKVVVNVTLAEQWAIIDAFMAKKLPVFR